MVTEIYKYGNPGDWAYDAMVAAVKLRYRLLPYIYSTAGMTVQNSELMVRPFVMDFPTDRRALLRDDEYMFGRNILVKPVTDPLYTWKDNQNKGLLINEDIRHSVDAVEVYLPAGCSWYDLYTGQRYDGGKAYMVPAPIDRIPAFARSGAIIPLGPDVQYATEKPWDNLDIKVYPGSDGSFVLYEDQGDGYDYEQGRFSTIQLSWEDASRTLSVADRQGAYKGMLSSRRFNVILPDGQSKAVEYADKAVMVAFP